jgi:hypothetical protein
LISFLTSSVADPDPGSGILDPVPDLGYQTHIFESLMTNSIILLKLAQIFFLQHFKNRIIFNFVKFVARKKAMTTNFFHPSLLLLFLDPGS